MQRLLSGLTAFLLLGMASPSSAGELPDAIKKAGVLHLSINATYPPLDYKDPASGKIIGVDVDLGDILAAKLGVKIEWNDVPFAQIIPRSPPAAPTSSSPESAISRPGAKPWISSIT